MLPFKPVHDVMNRALVSCPMTSSAREVARLIIDQRADAVIVVDPLGEAIGVIAPSDLVKVWDRSLDELDAEDLMSSPLPSIQGNASLEEAAQTMIEKGVHQLVVLHPPPARSRPVGILSQRHIVSEMLSS